MHPPTPSQASVYALITRPANLPSQRAHPRMQTPHGFYPPNWGGRVALMMFNYWEVMR